MQPENRVARVATLPPCRPSAGDVTRTKMPPENWVVTLPPRHPCPESPNFQRNARGDQWVDGVATLMERLAATLPSRGLRISVLRGKYQTERLRDALEVACCESPSLGGFCNPPPGAALKSGRNCRISP